MWCSTIHSNAMHQKWHTEYQLSDNRFQIPVPSLIGQHLHFATGTMGSHPGVLGLCAGPLSGLLLLCQLHFYRPPPLLSEEREAVHGLLCLC